MGFIDTGALNYPPNSANAIQKFEAKKDPTSADFKQFKIGTQWFNKATNDLFVLVNKNKTAGVWHKIGGGTLSGITTIDGNSGTANPVSGKVKIVGTGNISVAGAGDTLTVSSSGGGSGVSTLTGNSGGAISPDGAGNINVKGSNGSEFTGAGDTLTLDGTVNQVTTGTDSGVVTPVSGNININAGSGIEVNKVGSDVEISASGGGASVSTLTGNSGGAISPDGAGNINIEGSDGSQFTGAGGTLTLGGTINKVTTGTDSGVVTPVSGNININPGSGIEVKKVGADVEIIAKGGTLTGNSGGAISPDGAGNINIEGSNGSQFTGAGDTLTLDGTINQVTTGTDSGVVTPVSGNININAGSGVAVNKVGSNVEISASGGVSTLQGDSGTATQVSNNIKVVGSDGSQFTGAGDTLTLGGTINKVTTGTDSGVVTPVSGNININAGSGIEVKKVGADVEIIAKGGTLTGNSGGAISPDGAGNINIEGSNGSQFTGAGNTITLDGTINQVTTGTDSGVVTPVSGNININAGSGIEVNKVGSDVEIKSKGGGSISPYVVDPTDGDYSTIQAAINQAVTDGASSSKVISIWIRGDGGNVYNENLTIFDGIQLVGVTTAGEISAVVVNGKMTLPASGLCSFENISFSNSGANETVLEPTLTGALTVIYNGVTLSQTGSANVMEITGGSSFGSAHQFNGCTLTDNNQSSVNITGSMDKITMVNCTTGKISVANSTGNRFSNGVITNTNTGGIGVVLTSGGEMTVEQSQMTATAEVMSIDSGTTGKITQSIITSANDPVVSGSGNFVQCFNSYLNSDKISATLNVTNCGTPVIGDYVVDKTGQTGNYKDIQSALNQASTDGASATNFKTVYVKGNETVTYTENLTIPDGIKLVGLGIGKSTSRVVVTGGLTLPAFGQCSFTHFDFQSTGATITITEPTLTGALITEFIDCKISATSSATSVLSLGGATGFAGTHNFNGSKIQALGASVSFDISGSMDKIVVTNDTSISGKITIANSTNNKISNSTLSASTGQAGIVLTSGANIDVEYGTLASPLEVLSIASGCTATVNHTTITTTNNPAISGSGTFNQCYNIYSSADNLDSNLTIFNCGQQDLGKYVVDASGKTGNYKTIQTAINAAFADGASVASPLTVWVKGDSGNVYNETLNPKNGVHVKGLATDGAPESITVDAGSNLSVTLEANVTAVFENLLFKSSRGGGSPAYIRGMIGESLGSTNIDYTFRNCKFQNSGDANVYFNNDNGTSGSQNYRWIDCVFTAPLAQRYFWEGPSALNASNHFFTSCKTLDTASKEIAGQSTSVSCIDSDMGNVSFDYACKSSGGQTFKNSTLSGIGFGSINQSSSNSIKSCTVQILRSSSTTNPNVFAYDLTVTGVIEGVTGRPFTVNYSNLQWPNGKSVLDATLSAIDTSTIANNLTNYSVTSGDGESQYNSVSDAISQATTDSVSSTNPKTVVIKGDNSENGAIDLNEDIALVDGVHIVSMSNDGRAKIVNINGTVMLPVSGKASMSNVNVIAPAGKSCIDTGTLTGPVEFFAENCNFDATTNTGVTAVDIDSATAITAEFRHCNFTSPTLDLRINSNATVELNGNSSLNGAGQGIDISGTSTLMSCGTMFNNPVVVNGGTSTIINSLINTTSAPLVITNTPTINMYNSAITSTGAGITLPVNANLNMFNTSLSVATGANAILGSGNLKLAEVSMTGAVTGIASTIVATDTVNADILITPRQPQFYATAQGTPQNNVTGAGTVYVVQFTGIISQVGSGYDGTSTYTAERNGNHLFEITLAIDGLAAGKDEYTLELFKSNAPTQAYILHQCHPGNVRDTNDAFTVTCSKQLLLSTGDTIQVRITVNGGGGSGVNILNSTTTFSGRFLG